MAPQMQKKKNDTVPESGAVGTAGTRGPSLGLRPPPGSRGSPRRRAQDAGLGVSELLRAAEAVLLTFSLTEKSPTNINEAA